MESKIISLDFGVYASIQLHDGRVWGINKLIDGLGNDLCVLPIGFDSLMEIEDSSRFDDTFINGRSYRRVYKHFSMLNLISEEYGYIVIRILYHNVSRKVLFVSKGTGCQVFRLFSDFIVVKQHQIIKNDGSLLCDSEYNLHLVEGSSCYVACINGRWSIINKGSLSVIKMSDEITENDSEDDYVFASFINDKIQIKQYDESYLCDMQGRVLVKSYYGEYSYCDTDNGPVWLLTNTTYGSEVYDAEDYSFRYTIERILPSEVIDEEARPYMSNLGPFKVIRSNDYCFGIIEYSSLNKSISEIIPPIYPQLRIVDDWHSFIVSYDRYDDRFRYSNRSKYGIIDNKGRTRVPLKYNRIERQHIFYAVYGYDLVNNESKESYVGLLSDGYQPLTLPNFDYKELRIINAEPCSDMGCSKFILLIKDGKQTVKRYYLFRDGQLAEYDGIDNSRSDY